ncbi:CFI-box-CTERM domain-containing protein [Rhizobium ecuadorense]|uniref:CFI-box-CTERM domain-containing protein n=1 Tax=Rhizobium ecuadorense TaxID=1671795 RepID=UPI003CC7A163
MREGLVEKMKANANLDQMNSSAKLCFVAAALDGRYREEPLDSFLRFRDARLKATATGRMIIAVYYAASPIAAWLLRKSPILMRVSFHVLTALGNRLPRQR